MIISRDDSSKIYTVLHYGFARGSRGYQMSFGAGVWKIWRQAPGFSQRSGTLSDDRGSISATWEKSPDGSGWEHDVDLIYTKVK